MFRYTLVFIFLFSAFYLPVTLFSQEKTSLTTVVIDAGHGGKDPGTLGKQSQEKNINLGIALKLGGLIRDNCPDVKVIYTRDKDVFIELFERADIANRNHADLFISIHCNSNPTHTLHGAETYVMGLHRTHANLEIAKKENASILMEPDYTRNYNGFDPNSDESYITFTMFQNAFLDQSTNFAATVQDQFKDRAGMDDRGVRQAGFLVLYKTTMPSVLVESGFLSNPDEEKFLISDKGQEFIASAIFRAFVSFKKRTEAGGKEAIAFNPRPDSQQRPPETNIVNPVTSHKKDPVVNKTGNHDPPKKLNSKSSVICFRVQFMLNPKSLSLHSAKFAGLPDVKVYHHQGMFKYTTGEGKSVDDVMKYLDIAKEKGFKDAFIVAFNGEERITIAEAKRLLEEGSK
jgi:N-acetylmuramoyl-L-alanine amidase